MGITARHDDGGTFHVGSPWAIIIYRFPEAYWPHLRTTNVVESLFASVRLRTNAAKRFKKTKSSVYLVHQVMLRLEQSWHRLISAHLCGTVPQPPPPEPHASATIPVPDRPARLGTPVSATGRRGRLP